MSLARLVLVRHGETDFNAEGRMQGQLDSRLTVLGRDQAGLAAPLLARYRPERLISSDLGRAAETAEEIGAACGLPVKLDTRLRETHLGQWQGLTVAQVRESAPGVLARWREDSAWAPPAGESRLRVAERVLPLLAELRDELVGDPEPRTVLLCAHGGLIAALICAALELPPSVWGSFGGLGNCCWAVLVWRAEEPPRWRLTGYNLGVPE